jgi:hypothetical protein
MQATLYAVRELPLNIWVPLPADLEALASGLEAPLDSVPQLLACHIIDHIDFGAWLPTGQSLPAYVLILMRDTAVKNEERRSDAPVSQ